MNLKKLSYIFFALVMGVLASCSNNSGVADITAFTISGGTTTISGTNISVTFPFGTAVTSLTPTITISEGAAVNPASEVALDFTNPLFYTVTSEDGLTKNYIVSVTVATEVTYYIGDTGPAGGLVFYDRGRYTTGLARNWRYMEASPTDLAGNELQTIVPDVVPTDGTYTLSDGTNITGDIAYNANAVAINAALASASMGDIVATGDMLTTIVLTFGGAYVLTGHSPIVVAGDVDFDASPTVARIIGGGSPATFAWSNITSVLVGTNTGIGQGKANTEAIMAQAGHIYSAAKACADYSVVVDDVTYNDWFLPSKAELNKIYTSGVDLFSTSPHWSSSDIDLVSVWYQNFYNGSQNDNGKNLIYPVRAVRYF